MTARGCSRLIWAALLPLAGASVIAAVPSCGGQVDERPPADASIGDQNVDSEASVRCPGVFPKLPRACSDAAPNESCAFILHRGDCCGSETAYSVQASQLAAAQRLEDEWRRSCPLCGCKPGPTRTMESLPCPGVIGAQCEDSVDICWTTCSYDY
jgi:hypothetical protein